MLVRHTSPGVLLRTLRKDTMFRATRRTAIAAAALVAVGLAGCSGAADSTDTSPEETTSASAGEWTPVTVEHALGTTTVEEEPERVAAIGWANHEVALALGIVPVGMPITEWGDDDGDGVHPWVESALEDLGAETPVLYDETDGIDFEAVADSAPDVILAAYSGLTQDDYDTLSQIAPVVAYPETAWGTPWRQIIEVNSTALGLADEGDALVTQIEEKIAAAVAEHPQLDGATAMMVTHVDPSDLSEINFYNAYDTRTQFFEDLGMTIPESLVEVSTDPTVWNGSVSTEQADVFSDVDIFVTYGGQELIDALEADPLLSQLPAVANGSVVNLPGDSPLGTAANPTPLQVLESDLVEQYVALLADAADNG
ncbi:iron-siderophore ABC transporter substrate-binding protein [Ruania alba]|uniref:Iron complex transport system substrate-binding protein n=1 Tax=Ruania alba TaxID=648782 RepID=A0A1H5ETV1_9MICO|nr:iron-siderophore ABC transporter substrate-binding protein [Ruania alba]SED94512.1 iron complex transport system substrate-binding protein [Ruania alba]